MPLPLSSCPEIDELHRFANGRLDDQAFERIADHVAECETCVATLERASSQAMVPFVGELRAGYGVGDAAGEVGPGMPFGKYRLERLLGTGGMGQVWRARHEMLGRDYALKIMSPAVLSAPGAVTRFQREIAALGKLDDPHVVRATYADEVDGRHYLVMELIDGPDLTTLLTGVGPLAPADACEIARQAAAGLAAAHRLGLVHRDIKPSNLLLGRDGVVRIVDFGLARFAAGDASELTRAGQTPGTPLYMAPEQLRGERPDIRADLYSLGLTLYRLLRGGSGAVILRADERLSPPLVAVLERLLAAEPAGRYDSPDELASALAPLADGADLRRLVRAFDARTSGSPPAAVDPADTDRAAPVPPRAVIGRRSQSLARWVTFGLLLIGLGVVVARPWRDGKPPSAPPLDTSGAVGHPADPKGSLESQPTAAPSPLDGLDPSRVPAGLRFAGQPPELVAAMVNPRGWHAKLANAVAVSPNIGSQLVSGAYDPIVRVWNSRTLLLDQELTGHGNDAQGRTCIWSVAIASDGHWLASGDSLGVVRTWRRESHGYVATHEFAGHGGWVHGVAFLPNGRLISGAFPGQLRIFHLDNSRPPIVFDNGDEFLCLAVSDDGAFLASGSQRGHLRVWDMTGAEPVPCDTRRVHDGMLRSVAWLPDGSGLATCGGWPADQHVRLTPFRERRLQEPVLVGEHTRFVSAVAVHPRQPWIVSVGSDIAGYRVWDYRERRELFRVPQAGGIEIVSVAFSPEGRRFYSAGLDRNLHVWNVTFDPPSFQEVTAFGEDNAVTALAFAPEGRLVSAQRDGSLRWWDVTRPAPVELFAHQGPPSPITTLAICPRGETFVAGGGTDRDIYRWDLRQQRPLPVEERRSTFLRDVLDVMPSPEKWSGHAGELLSLEFSADGQSLASTSADATARSWRVANGSREWQAACPSPGSPFENRVLRSVLAPDARWLATASRDGVVRVWRRDGESWRGPLPQAGRVEEPTALTFTSDGRFLICGEADGRLLIWRDPFDGTTEPRTILELRARIERLTCPPPGTVSRPVCLSTDAKGRVLLFRADTGETLRTWRFPAGITAARFAPDGRHLGLGSATGTIYVVRWNVGTTSPGNASTGALVGVVFEDVNGSGTSSSDEPGLPQRRVFVDANDDGQFDSGEMAESTGTDGGFRFSSLPPGRHTVRVEVPAGWQLTSPREPPQVVEIHAGELAKIDLGLFRTVRFGGLVFDDRNADGDHDPGEPPLVGVTISADTNQNDRCDATDPSAQSGPDGRFVLAGLGPGPIRLYGAKDREAWLAMHLLVDESAGWKVSLRPGTHPMYITRSAQDNDSLKIGCRRANE